MDNSMLNPALNRRTFLKGTSLGVAAIAADMALPWNFYGLHMTVGMAITG